MTTGSGRVKIIELFGKRGKSGRRKGEIAGPPNGGKTTTIKKEKKKSMLRCTLSAGEQETFRSTERGGESRGKDST